MSDEAPRPRTRGWVAPSILLVLAALVAAAALADVPAQMGARWWRVAIMLGIVAVAIAVWELRRRPPAPAPPVEIEPGLAQEVRAERERLGEVAAVEMLRAEQPELSLPDAVALVRGL